MGSYACTLAPSTINRGNSRDQNEEKAAAKLLGKRLAVAGEPEDGLRLNEALIKRLTGDEVLPMKKLFKDDFDGRNQVKLVIAANFKPIIENNDPAVWARMSLVPFQAPST